MSTHLRGASLLALLLLVAFCCACPTADQAAKLARANHRFANALDKTEQLTWQFYQSNVIDKSTYLTLNQTLTDVNALGRDYHAKARVYNGENPVEFAKISDDVRDLVIQKIQDGTLRIQNEAARRQWAAVAENVAASVRLAVEIAKTIKPKQS